MEKYFICGHGWSGWLTEFNSGENRYLLEVIVHHGDIALCYTEGGVWLKDSREVNLAISNMDEQGIEQAHETSPDWEEWGEIEQW